MSELHRPADVVVVGEGQGLVTEVRGGGGQLGWIGGAVAERVGGVAVQLDVGTHVQSRCRYQRPLSGSQKTTTSLPSSSTSSK
jgi:hypothetical protein